MSHLEAVLRVALICLAFFTLHSLMVAEWFKSLAARVLGRSLMQGWYRLTYTALSVLSLLICIWLIFRIPDHYIYSFPWWLSWPMHLVQLAALLFGYMSYRQLRTGEFTGRTQAGRYLRGEEQAGDMEGITDEGLTREGGYGVVRNPLYLAGIVVFAFEPDITRNWATLSVLAILYFVWGALIEERRMRSRLGDEYRSYMKDIPLLIPRPRQAWQWLRQLVTR